jgi:phage terminase small subunit
MKLTPRQKRFVEEYLVDLNATRAAIRAGYSAKRASEIAHQLLQKTTVQKAVSEAMRAREKRTEITQDRVLREYARLAFFDPRKFFDENGALRPVVTLDEDTAAALAGMDVVEIGNETVGFGQIRKLKLADRKGALDSLARHLGMFVDRVKVSGGAELRIVSEFADE